MGHNGIAATALTGTSIHGAMRAVRSDPRVCHPVAASSSIDADTIVVYVTGRWPSVSWSPATGRTVAATHARKTQFAERVMPRMCSVFALASDMPCFRNWHRLKRCLSKSAVGGGGGSMSSPPAGIPPGRRDQGRMSWIQLGTSVASAGNPFGSPIRGGL